MKDKKKKNFKLLIITIAIICLCLVGYFVLFGNRQVKQETRKDKVKNQENNEYKMIKLLDYSEKVNNNNGTELIYTGKYYILGYSVDNVQHAILYDDKGNNVTKEKIGTDDIKMISTPFGNDNYESFIVTTSDNRYGLFDKDFNAKIAVGNYVIEHHGSDNYLIVGNLINNYATIERLGNVGLFDKNGKEIIPREYESLFFGGSLTGDSYYDATKIFLYARKNGKYGVIDINNKVIIPFEYDRENSKLTIGLGEVFKNNDKNYFILYKNGKYGVVDENNTSIINFDKNKLVYNKYANAIMEKIYDNNKLSKINVYSINGELKKEIILNDNFNGDFNSYYYKIGYDSLVLYDNDYIYILNNKFEYDKYLKPANMLSGRDTNLYLAFDNFYLKGDDKKYKIYKSSDNSLLFNDEYKLVNAYPDEMLVLCKNSSDKECGIIDKNGNIIIDFVYKNNMKNDNELIEIAYNNKTLKYDIKRTKINGDCAKDKEYYIRENVIKTDSGIYDLKCNKISEAVSNIYNINDNLILTEKFEDKDYNTYKIYDINTKKVANIENIDDAIITNHIRTNKLADKLDVVITDKGIYRIVAK